MFSVSLAASGELVKGGFQSEDEALQWLKNQYGDNPPEGLEAWLRGFTVELEDDSFDWMRYRHGGDVAHDGWGDSGFEI